MKRILTNVMCLVTVAVMSSSLVSLAQGSPESSPAPTAAAGSTPPKQSRRPLKRLRSKVHNMRPLVRRRNKKKAKSMTAPAAVAPSTTGATTK